MDVLRRNFREIDFTIIGTLALLAVFSCLALIAATYGKAGIPNSNVPTHPLTKQIVYEIIGFVMMGVFAVVDYRTLRKARWWIYAVCLLLLIVVFKMPALNNAHSWIFLGSMTFEPSELAKLGLIIAVAGFMANIDEQEFPDYRLRKSWPIWLLFLVPFALTMKEPALGQGLVLFAILMVMLAAWVKRSHFIILMILFTAVVVGIAVVVIHYPTQSTSYIETYLVGKWHLIKPFEALRIVTWLNPTYQLQSAGYQVHAAQMAVGSGQVFGEGLFNGIETNGGWIPVQWTDFIFTSIGEEFGFVGSSVLILLFLVLFYRLSRIAASAQDTFGTYVLVGVVGMFAFQVFENIGMNIYLSPATGITLPFISYGGSSLVVDYVAMGIAMSICLRRKKLRFN